MKKSLLTFALVATLSPLSHAAIPDGGWSVTPKEGSTVAKITEITVSKTNEHYMDPYVNRTVKINGEAISITQKATNNGGTMVMTLATPVEKSGVYEIIVPARTFTYGFSMWGDEEDNPEISWSVTVDNPDQPQQPDIPEVTVTADPATGAIVKSLGNITLTFDGASTVAASQSAAPILTSGGKKLNMGFSFTQGTAANQIVMTLNPTLEISGDYTITLPEGTFDLTAEGGASFASTETKLNYTVKTPPMPGEKFTVDKIRYIVLTREPMMVAVTWPESEADYAGLTTVPTSVTYEGETYAVTEIGSLAFSEVNGISDFTVPEGITRIGEGAFWTSSLSSITLPSSVIAIGGSAFEECKSLKSFTLPATVTSIGESLLYGCATLETVNLPEGLSAIPEGFVQGCVMLTRLDVPSTVKEIGEFAMSECTELATTNIPDGVTTLGRFAYAYCTALKTLPVPESVTSMGHGVFYQAGLTEATLPDNLTVIPDGTFQCCTELKEFTIGSNVTEIEKEAFYWCFGLKKITFGEKVATIGEGAFTGDEAIAEVISLNPVPPTGAEFAQAVYDKASLTVPEGAAEAYRAAPGWKEFNDINDSAGISAPEAAGALAAQLDGSALHITAPGEVVLVNAVGMVIYAGPATTVTLPARGIYLLTGGTATVKIAY